MPGKGPAFVKGGIGCIVLFFVLGFLAVVFGGRVHLDLGGLLLLFLVGGVLGLIVWAIYQKGRRDAGGGGGDREPPSGSSGRE
jgi:hypothetical protein